MSAARSLVGVRLSRHALDVMSRRGVDALDVADVLRDPQSTEADGTSRRYVRDGLAVVVAEDGPRPVVVTVLLRSVAQWTDHDVRTRRVSA